MDNRAKILVVDDEEIMREALSDWLREDGYIVEVAGDGYKALEMVKREDFNVLLVDLKMPGIDGIGVLKRVKELKGDIPVLIITAYATVETAILAMKEGAYDYVVKPFNAEEVSLMIQKIVDKQNLIKENILLRRELTRSYRFHDIVGKSSAMTKVFEMIRVVAPTKSTVLITGESGTGKEMVARAIHNFSYRDRGPFITISCGSLPDNLLESELFGYEKGAFTGAVRTNIGLIETADNGTLFLDEIGEISPKTQVDLLRVIQEKKFTRIGSTKETTVDVRIIAATNRDLKEMVEGGRFREDLYYRLNVITLNVPPLRERREDIPLLIDHFLKKHSTLLKKGVEDVSPAARRLLMNYSWPGNVRELENAIEHSIVVARRTVIEPEDLPDSLKGDGEDIKTGRTLKEVERDHIMRTLEQNGYNISDTARALDINRVTLYRKMKEYGLKRKDGRK